MTPEAKHLVRQRYAEILETDQLGQTVSRGLDLGVADELLGAQILATVQHDLVSDLERRIAGLATEVDQLRALMAMRWQSITPSVS